ncbi:MAG: transglycosylase domain-containing protein [Chloroflexi bacterium]|nr:transglycosylase domain-containing protein [Chloroflexota bacterium]
MPACKTRGWTRKTLVVSETIIPGQDWGVEIRKAARARRFHSPQSKIGDMQKYLPILRARRERRLEEQRKTSGRARGALLGFGMVFSLLLAALILLGAFAYADVTRDLPSVEILPRLLNPPDGLLLQPTRIYDRTGLHPLFRFSSAPEDAPRRYIPINEQNPQRLPGSLVNAALAVADPRFWSHSGYTLQQLDDPDAHPTIAQKLVSDLILYNEEPSLRRAVRERILAAQITAQFGRGQIIEWYLNSVHFGRYAFGADAAARLYFDKPADQLTPAESAILAAASETPALNPLDAPQVALQRGREVLHKMNRFRLLSNEALDLALAENPTFADPPPPQPLSAFVNLVLAQAGTQIPRDRIERGGLNVITTLDFDLQTQAACATEVYAARMAGLPEPKADCPSARLLPSLPPAVTLSDSSASALILDSKTGQVLALVGETVQGVETPLVAAHPPGSSLDAFVYLTGFTRGLSPASLTWDIPPYGDFANDSNIQNFDGEFHGPMRLRTALANDYQVPVETLRRQMGIENVADIEASFGIDSNADVTMLKLAGAYGVFGTQGVYFGQNVGGDFAPASALKIETADHAVLLDWTLPQAKPVLTPALAYLMTDVLSDEAAARLPALNIGRPAGVKVGQTIDEKDAWVVGYTPSRVVVAWTGVHSESESVTPRFPAVLWNALMQTASASLPADGWTMPQGVSTVTVCEPSGMLPTRECPNLVNEVFLNGNEPVQADTLFREFDINRETGLLATVFTPPELIEKRVYMIVPEAARNWALSAGLEIPPASYDAIQSPPFRSTVNIVSPALFAEVSGTALIMGTASGDDFSYYRVQVGKGLNPTTWTQLGGDVTVPVENGVLAEWDTTGLNGLYAVQLQVVRSNQAVDTAVIQVTVK